MKSSYPTIVLDVKTYWKSEFLDEVEAELQAKSITVNLGIEELSSVDVLAYHIMKENGYFNTEETNNE